MRTNHPIHYDLIGDVHGRHHKLTSLLHVLGYEERDGAWRHPEGRVALFLGDLIDPKGDVDHDVPRVLELVHDMIEADSARCLMGNHEFNALCYHTRGPDGEPLRAHTENNKKHHRGTLEAFPDWESPTSEWRTVWLPWMKRLPLWLDLPGLRAIHATWHPAHVETVDSHLPDGDEFLIKAATKGSPEYEAIETLLKGVEVSLPDGHTFCDHTGHERDEIRVRWWHPDPAGCPVSDLVFPENHAIPPAPLHPEAAAEFPGYPADAVPLFFGHYYKPADSEHTPEAHNLACLDHSAATDGPLLAYRWSGEATIKLENYRTHEGDRPA